MSDAIDALDLSAFEARYGTEGPGKQAFDPRMMVKVLVYAYATGTFSSRKIAAKLVEDVAFRVLAADNFPAHRTIADFRQRHPPEFRELFVQVVRMAREVGLVNLGTVAVDGTKAKANASKHKAMSYRRMQEEESRRIDGYVAMGREKNGTQKVPSAELEATRRMMRKMATERGRKTYRKRKWIGEPPFAWIKSAMGFDRFRLRGLTKATSEWNLACLAANLRRMHGKVVFG